jgi:hypothetical protein
MWPAQRISNVPKAVQHFPCSGGAALLWAIECEPTAPGSLHRYAERVQPNFADGTFKKRIATARRHKCNLSRPFQTQSTR